MIPANLFRVVPAKTTDEVEERWRHTLRLHPNWHCITYRDPIDPFDFPATRDAWEHCTSGAQLAGLVRLEALWNHGGIYLDSDVDVLRPLDPLLTCEAFACYEDESYVPDAVMGASPAHPAIESAIRLAVARVPEGAQSSGPLTSTDVFRNRTDVLCLPPDCFYPYHYSQKWRADEDFSKKPWTFGVHRWAGSWL